MRESVSTRHINGKIYHFYPATTTSKSEASFLAAQLRGHGYKARIFHVYSSWNKRMQYEVFTNPKHGDAKLIEKFPGGRR